MSFSVERWLRTLLFSSAITQGVIYIVRPMITYRALELDASPAMIGYIAALYALLPVMMALTFGRWVGVIGEGRFILFGTLGMALSSATLLVADSIPLLAISASLAGLAHLACMVGGQTMVSLRSDSNKYEENFGYYTFSASLGQMVGPILGAIVAGTSGALPKSTANAFLIALLFSVIALFPVMRWRSHQPTVIAAKNDHGALKSAGKLLKNKRVFAAIYTSLAISSVGDILIVFLPLYGAEKSFSSLSIGVILAIRAGASMLSRLSLGALSARFTTRNILIYSNLISIVACAAIAFAPNEWVLALIVLIAGFSLGVGQPLTMSLVSQATKPEERALAVSTRLMGNRFGQFILPAGAGLLAAGAGTGGVFFALSILLMTTFIPSQN
jgi:MFS family permease